MNMLSSLQNYGIKINWRNNEGGDVNSVEKKSGCSKVQKLCEPLIYSKKWFLWVTSYDVSTLSIKLVICGTQLGDIHYNTALASSARRWFIPTDQSAQTHQTIG